VAAGISREALYGVREDSQLPLHLQDDARLPFLGFCGQRYEIGGTVFVAINPGGGGDAYATRMPQDCTLLPLIERFMQSPNGRAAQTFSEISDSYLAMARTWNLWRFLGPAVEACNIDPEAICYLNCFPFRTRKDALPFTHALRESWQRLMTPLLAELQPKVLVVLGKKAGNVVQKLHTGGTPVYVIPRTVGDSYLSPAALEVLSALRDGVI